jgi:hypothetical protein
MGDVGKGAQQRVGGTLCRQMDEEVVDGPTVSVLDRLHLHDVTTGAANRPGDRRQRAGSISQRRPQQVEHHDLLALLNPRVTSSIETVTPCRRKR